MIWRGTFFASTGRRSLTNSSCRSERANSRAPLNLQRLQISKNIQAKKNGAEAPSLKVSSIESLERKLRSQLKLPRVKRRSGCANSAAGAGDAVAKMRRNLVGNKVRRSIHGKYLINVGVVEKVESIHRKIQHLPLTHVDCPGKSQVHGFQGVAAIAVAG